MSIVETLKLGKSFGHFEAVRDVDFRVDPGELRAVIGPNGAGKTTFFNLIAGTIAPTSGTIRYRGRDVSRVSGTRRVHLGMQNLYSALAVADRCYIIDQGEIKFEGTPADVRSDEALRRRYLHV